MVLTNQLSLFVVLAFAFGIGGDGPVSAYTYGWSFMQMPYAVVVVSVLGVLTPQLAGIVDRRGLRGAERTTALRTSPVARHHHPVHAGALVLAQPLVGILLEPPERHATIWPRWHGARGAGRGTAGLHGLPTLRARTAVDAARARGLLSLRAENALTIALCVVLGRHSIAGLTASVSIAYSAAAIVALVVLARHQVNIASVIWSRPRAAQPRRVARRGARHGRWPTPRRRGTSGARTGHAFRRSRSSLGLVAYTLVVVVLQRRVTRVGREKMQG